MPTGRPPLWATPEELNNDIDSYIEDVKIRGVFAHKKGFAAWKNCSYDSVFEYLSNKGPSFSEPIKRLEILSEVLAADMMVRGKALNGDKIDTTGSIFVAKNLLRETYEDKQKTEHSGVVVTETRDENLDELSKTAKGQELILQMYDELKKDE